MVAIVIQGLSGSGKTTWTEKFVAEHSGWVNVNRDDIRLALYGRERMYKGDENRVSKVQKKLIQNAGQSGQNVIISDTNLNKTHLASLLEFLESQGFSVTFKSFLDVPVEECIRRDSLREFPVGARVIRSQAKMVFGELPKPKNYTIEKGGEFDFSNQDPSKRHAIVVDMDGTFALFNKTDKNDPSYRNPYDCTTCINDKLNVAVWVTVNAMRNMDFDIVIVSGRKEEYRPQTEEWLAKHNVKYDALFMRSEGDNRGDDIVKLEIYRDKVIPNWYVQYVLDDRNRVVDAIREAGLTVFQVAPGDF